MDDPRDSARPESENIDDRREESDTQDSVSDTEVPKTSKVVDYILAPPPEGAGKGISAEAGYYDVGGRRGSAQKGEKGSGQGDTRSVKGAVLSGAYAAGGPVDARATRREYKKKSPFRL